MKRPIKNDYLTTNQLTYDEKLDEYYEQLEKYIDYIEQQLNLACVSPAIEDLKDFAYNNCQLHNTEQLDEIIKRL